MAEVFDHLTSVKHALGITGEYQDATIQEYIRAVKEFMVDSGVAASIVDSGASAGAVARGVSDLWNYGAGGGQFSTYFLMRIGQLAFLEVVT